MAVDVSTFGRRGPQADVPGGDLMALAESGMLSVLSTNPADGPLSPIRLRGELTEVFAGLHAAIAAVGALHARLRDGRGQRIDVAAIEAMVTTMATALPTVTYAGLVPVAGGARGVCPWGIYECRDGAFLVQCTEDGQWRALVKMLGDPSGATSRCSRPRPSASSSTTSSRTLVREAVADMTRRRVPRDGPRGGRAGVPVSTRPAEAMAWEQLGVRHSFRELVIGEGRAGGGAGVADPHRRRRAPRPPGCPDDRSARRAASTGRRVATRRASRATMPRSPASASST